MTYLNSQNYMKSICTTENIVMSIWYIFWLVYQTGARNALKYRMTKTNQYKACLTRLYHCRDLFRGELSRNQVILQNIHLMTENTGGLCGVFDKTEAFEY